MRFILIIIIFFLFENFQIKDDGIPIRFEDYDVEIQVNKKLGDTIRYNKSDVEDFKFVFFDPKGKCYCERFIKGKLYEKGYYENSLDTLKTYASGRFSNGTRTKIVVRKYFEPLKNGNWIIYRGKDIKVEKFIMGVPEKKLNNIPD